MFTQISVPSPSNSFSFYGYLKFIFVNVEARRLTKFVLILFFLTLVGGYIRLSRLDYEPFSPLAVSSSTSLAFAFIYLITQIIVRFGSYKAGYEFSEDSYRVMGSQSNTSYSDVSEVSLHGARVMSLRRLSRNSRMSILGQVDIVFEDSKTRDLVYKKLRRFSHETDPFN